MLVPEGGVLFVHSAFKNLGREGYRAETVLQAFVDYMKEGTLLLPTMSWRYVKPNKPYFDVKTTPSNVGILTELFRQQYAEYRSIHPTHSVAGKGVQAASILSEHQCCIVPCGATSPFAKLISTDAYIIMLGVGMDCCTLIHHVEELLAPQYYVKPESETEDYHCQDQFGDFLSVKLRRHLFLPRNYWQFQDKLATNDDLIVFRCDNTISLGFQAKKLFNVVSKTLKNKPDAIIARPGQRYRMM